MTRDDKLLRLQVSRLRAERDTALERVAQLEALFDGEDLPAVRALGLTRSEATILACLLRLPGVVGYDAILTALYGGRADGGPGKDTLKVIVHKMRPKLARHGVAIRCVWGVGYELDREVRSRLLEPDLDPKNCTPTRRPSSVATRALRPGRERVV